MLNVVVPDLSRIEDADPERHAMTGETRVQQLNASLGGDDLKMTVVWFEAGARTRPHVHNEFDQYLCYLDGTGVVAIDGGEDVVVPAGQLVRLPKRTLHMHGATSDGPAMHLSIVVDFQDLSFDEPVPAAWQRFARPA
jgi:quercetin dioxygenase-like cupin family protein